MISFINPGGVVVNSVSNQFYTSTMTLPVGCIPATAAESVVMMTLSTVGSVGCMMRIDISGIIYIYYPANPNGYDYFPPGVQISMSQISCTYTV